MQEIDYYRFRDSSPLFKRPSKSDLKERERERESRFEGERSMGSKEQTRAALYEKLKQLRSITHSSAVNKTSIIVDAAKYIEELKDQVERLNEDVGSSQTSSEHDSLPMQVTVETLDKGFRINVFSEKDCPGLLVSILEAFEELGLDVLDANVSCSDNFHLEAIGENEGQLGAIDAQVVKQAVLQAIKNWSESSDQED